MPNLEENKSTTLEFLEWALAAIDSHFQETGKIEFSDVIIWKAAKQHCRDLINKHQLLDHGQKVYFITEEQVEALGTQLVAEYSRATSAFKSLELLPDRSNETCFTTVVRAFLNGIIYFKEPHHAHHSSVKMIAPNPVCPECKVPEYVLKKDGVYCWNCGKKLL